MTKWAVYFHGSEEQMKGKRYSYKIEFSSKKDEQDSRSSMIYQGRVVPAPRDDAKFMFSRYHSFWIHRTILEDLVEHGQLLYINVSIYCLDC